MTSDAVTLQGKISREDIADLCAALLDTPAACDTTFEIKSTVPFSQPFEVDPSRPLPPRNWQARDIRSSRLKLCWPFLANPPCHGSCVCCVSVATASWMLFACCKRGNVLIADEARPVSWHSA